MAVKVQSTIEPYNNSYMVANAKHVGVGEPGEEKPLSEVLENLPSGGGDITVDSELSLTSENPVQNKAITQEFKAFNEAIGDTNRRVSALERGGVGGGGEYEIPTFDLAALGMPVISINDSLGVSVNTDTTAIRAALETGAVKFNNVVLNFGDENITFDVVMSPIEYDGYYFCAYVFGWRKNVFKLELSISAGSIVGYLEKTSVIDSDAGEESNPAWSDTIPTFDLAALGLSTIIPNGQYVQLQTDTTALIEALEKGAVKFICPFNMGADISVSLVLNPACVLANGQYACTSMNEFNDTMLITTIGVGNGYIAAKCTPMDNIIGAYIDVALGGDY